MSNIPATAPPEPQAPETVPAPEGQPAAAKPEVLTPEQVQYVQEMIAKGGEETFRKAQGLVDVNASRIEEKVQGVVKTIAEMRDQGVTVTPAQEQAMKSKALTDAMAETPPQSPDPGAQPQTADPAQAEVPFTAKAWQLMQDAGVDINTDDPEFATLDRQGDGFAFVKSVESAITVKKARLDQTADTPPQAPDRLPTNSVAQGNLTVPNLLEMDKEKLYDKAFRQNK